MGFELIGNLHAVLIDLGTGARREWHHSNTITSGGLSIVRDYLLASDPSAAPIPPSYFAVGSGTDAGRYHTAVAGEKFRAAIVQRDANGQGLTYHAFLGPFDNQNETTGAEGLYAGDATGEVGTGTLFAVAGVTPFNKNVGNTYSLDWNITVSGKL